MFAVNSAPEKFSVLDSDAVKSDVNTRPASAEKHEMRRPIEVVGTMSP